MNFKSNNNEIEVDHVAEISIISSHSSIQSLPVAVNPKKEVHINRTSGNYEQLRRDLFGNDVFLPKTEPTKNSSVAEPHLIQGQEIRMESSYDIPISIYNCSNDSNSPQSVTDHVNITKFEAQRSEIKSQFIRK